VDVSKEGVLGEEFPPTDLTEFLIRFGFGITAYVIEKICGECRVVEEFLRSKRLLASQGVNVGT